MEKCGNFIGKSWEKCGKLAPKPQEKCGKSMPKPLEKCEIIVKNIWNQPPINNFNQVITVDKYGEAKIQKFDMEAAAKKYGISVSGNTKKTKEKTGGTNTKKKKTK